MSIYTARATREGHWWVVDVTGVGVTQARNLADAKTMARDLVSIMRQVEASEVEIDLVPVLPTALEREVRKAREANEAAKQAQERAAESWRTVAEHLVRTTGLSNKDAAAVLNISPQRVSQLAPTRRGRAHASSTASGKAAAMKGENGSVRSHGKRG